MSIIQIKVGVYTPNQPERFEVKLRAFLEENGELSTVKGRGLSIVSVKSRQVSGTYASRVFKVVHERPGISLRKIGRALTDLEEKQISAALRRLVRDKELEATRKDLNGYKYYVYKSTPLGVSAQEGRDEDYEAGKRIAPLIWAAFRTLGYKAGSEVDIRKAQKTTETDTPQEFYQGLRTLIAAGKVEVMYNADGKGKHRYLIPARK